MALEDETDVPVVLINGEVVSTFITSNDLADVEFSDDWLVCRCSAAI